MIEHKKNISLSVIIPIYNACKTLDRCLDSVLGQTRRDIEVICIDDESTDDSLKMCHKYQKIDSRVKVIHKKNGGVASARNEGLKMAQGIYVTFIDQDDWIEADAYERMLALGIKQQADMIVCGYSKDIGDSVKKMQNRSEIPEVIESGDDLIRYAFYREEYRGFAAFVWSKLFKREMLVANDIMFDATLTRGDDVLFFSKVATVAKRTVYVNESFYHYIQREDSITHTRTKSNIERLANILTGYERAIDVLEKSEISDDVIDYMRCFYVYHASVLYELARDEGLVVEQERFRASMRLYLTAYKRQNNFDETRIKRIEELLN